MKKIIPFIFILLVISASAHEFWLQPDKFYYKKGENANIKFLVGENFEGNNWSGDNARIKNLLFYNGKLKADISKLVSERKGDSILLPVNEEGTMMITFNSNNSFIRLEPAQFNAYLQEDGLTNAIEYRKQNNETDSIGKELYQRNVKTIFQAGQHINDTFFNETDLPLDIIPLKNPYALKDGDSLTVKILFQKKPLIDHEVKLWQRQKDKLTHLALTTNKKGEIGFAVSLHGRWMISSVYMMHLKNNPEADWQSYWGSCTWGYE